MCSYRGFAETRSFPVRDSRELECDARTAQKRAVLDVDGLETNRLQRLTEGEAISKPFLAKQSGVTS